MNITFVRAALALALVCSVEGDADNKQDREAARHIHKLILRLMDKHKPEGFDEIMLNELWATLDGPVSEILNTLVTEV